MLLWYLWLISANYGFVFFSCFLLRTLVRNNVRRGVWRPRFLNSQFRVIRTKLCIMCLNCLKNDLFVNIKVICVIMILCKVLSIVNLNRVCNYRFCGGCFCKIQCIYYMAANFAFKSKVKVKLSWIWQNSWNSKSFPCFQN